MLNVLAQSAWPAQCKRQAERLVTAFSILVHTETTMPSGFFLKKKPPCTIFKWQHVNRKRSSRVAIPSEPAS